MANEKLFLIDICGTIYRSNTTFDFMEFWFSDVRWFNRLMLIKKHKTVGFINAIIFRIFGLDLIRSYVISHLKGLTEHQLKEMTEKFYDSFLSQVINSNVMEIINTKREAGYRLVIVSATLDCIAKEVAMKLNILEQFSSELEYKNGICTGRLKTDWLSSKLKNLQNRNVDLSNIEVITDNYDDTDIIGVSVHAYLVQYEKNKINGLVA